MASKIGQMYNACERKDIYEIKKLIDDIPKCENGNKSNDSKSDDGKSDDNKNDNNKLINTNPFKESFAILFDDDDYSLWDIGLIYSCGIYKSDNENENEILYDNFYCEYGDENVSISDEESKTDGECKSESECKSECKSNEESKTDGECKNYVTSNRNGKNELDNSKNKKNNKNDKDCKNNDAKHNTKIDRKYLKLFIEKSLISEYTINDYDKRPVYDKAIDAAGFNGQLYPIKMIVDHCIKCNFGVKPAFLPLTCYRGNLRLIDSLVKNGIISKSLSIIILSCKLDVIDRLVKIHSLNQTAINNYLSIACQAVSNKDSLKIVKYFLKLGGNDYQLALENACRCNNVKVVDYFLDLLTSKVKSDTNPKKVDWPEIFYSACASSNIRIVKKILNVIEELDYNRAMLRVSFGLSQNSRFDDNYDKIEANIPIIKLLINDKDGNSGNGRGATNLPELLSRRKFKFDGDFVFYLYAAGVDFSHQVETKSKAQVRNFQTGYTYSVEIRNDDNLDWRTGSKRVISRYNFIFASLRLFILVDNLCRIILIY